MQTPIKITNARFSFNEWMRQVDFLIEKRTGGLWASDLPDYCYRDRYDQGATHSKAASEAIRNARE